MKIEAKRKSRRSGDNKPGFTLIEMLVVVSIVMLMVGGGIAGYLRFNERQTLRNEAKTLQVLLRSAQKKARVGDKPAACDKLLSYAVVMTSGSRDVTMTVWCENGSYSTDNNYTLPLGVTPTDNHDIRFRVLHGGVEYVSGNENIELEYRDTYYGFQVTFGGEITEGDFVTD